MGYVWSLGSPGASLSVKSGLCVGLHSPCAFLICVRSGLCLGLRCPCAFFVCKEWCWVFVVLVRFSRVGYVWFFLDLVAFSLCIVGFVRVFVVPVCL